jgi:hypothetical protein
MSIGLETQSPVSCRHGAAAEEFVDPIGAIENEDRNEMAVCRRLSAIVDDMAAEATREHAEAVLQYLMALLPAHEADKSDLLPLLRQRCLPEDRIEAILDRLCGDQERYAELVGRLEPDLAALASGSAVGRPLDFVMHALAFAEARERQIAWESYVVLPLAAQRLTAGDLVQLGARMAERRFAAPA